MYSSQNSYDKFTAGVNTPPPLYKDSTTPPPPLYKDSTTLVTESTTGSQFYSSNSYAESTDKVDWSSGLCDCFSDARNSCGVNGALYTIIACVTGFPCCYSCFYRTKLRQQYGIKGTHSRDCLVHCFCEYCSLCQEYRELKKHGFDLSIGWHGNVERKNRNMEMASLPPVVERGMTR
ncbi:Protein PLANT CADMIUM RESISTANCE 2 [Linum perenne]